VSVRSRSFSARFDAALVGRLREQSRRTGQSSSRLAERYIDEGLRSEQFPGIVFRPGPTGRRAGLAGGPDVWEVVADLRRAADAGLDDPVAAVATSMTLDRSQVRLAAAYYDAYPDEVDERIRLNEEMAERVERTLAGRR
jgi:hypothetical protein